MKCLNIHEQGKIHEFLQDYYPFLDGAETKNTFFVIKLYEMICTEAILLFIQENSSLIMNFALPMIN